MANQKITPIKEVNQAEAPYWALIMISSQTQVG
jgi:hypothetical protein